VGGQLVNGRRLDFKLFGIGPTGLSSQTRHGSLRGLVVTSQRRAVPYLAVKFWGSRGQDCVRLPPVVRCCCGAGSGRGGLNLSLPVSLVLVFGRVWIRGAMKIFLFNSLLSSGPPSASSCAVFFFPFRCPHSRLPPTQVI
jgi:hypothetical protein